MLPNPIHGIGKIGPWFLVVLSVGFNEITGASHEPRESPERDEDDLEGRA